MTPDRLQSAAPFIAAGLLVVAVALFLLSLRYFRKSRTDFYWRRRRSAGQRGWRLFVWSLSLSLVSGVICLGTGVVGLVQVRSLTATAAALNPTATIRVTVITNTPSDTNTATLTTTPTSTPTVPTKTPSLTKSPTATAQATATVTSTSTSAVTASVTSTIVKTVPATDTPTSSPTQAVTTTPTPSLTASPGLPSLTPGGPPATTIQLHTATPTPTATITLTPTITLTASQTLVPAIANTTVLVSSVTPSAKAMLSITALDTQLSTDLGPVAASNTFTAGFNRIYFFVKFSAMQSGVLWRRQLIQDGTVLEDTNYLWGSAQQGTAYFFFGQQDGFKPGNYEVRLYLGQNSQPITTAAFTVK